MKWRLIYCCLIITLSATKVFAKPTFFLPFLYSYMNSKAENEDDGKETVVYNHITNGYRQGQRYPHYRRPPYRQSAEQKPLYYDYPYYYDYYDYLPYDSYDYEEPPCYGGPIPGDQRFGGFLKRIKNNRRGRKELEDKKFSSLKEQIEYYAKGVGEDEGVPKPLKNKAARILKWLEDPEGKLAEELEKEAPVDLDKEE